MSIKRYFFSLFILSILFFSMSYTEVYADSPVTSTSFYKAYTDVDIVKVAKEKGTINQEIADYLHSGSNPIDVKAAVINALGWKFEGKSNAKDYVKLIYSKDINDLDESSLSRDDLFCISYMMALDNYFHVDKAVQLMEKAQEQNRSSFTVSIIESILKGQQVGVNGSNNSTMIWLNTEKILNDKTLVQDMRQEAIDIIVKYMILYRERLVIKPNIIKVKQGDTVVARINNGTAPYTISNKHVASLSDSAKYTGQLFLEDAGADAKLEIRANEILCTGVSPGTISARVKDKNGLEGNILICIYPAEKSNEEIKTSATNLVNYAINNPNFYNFNMAYIEIMKLPEGEDRQTLLSKLNTVSDKVWTLQVKKAVAMLEQVCVQKDGKTYAEVENYLSTLSESEMDKMTQGYLLGELTGWGKKYVFTNDYVNGLNALSEAWSKKDVDSIDSAKSIILQVENTLSRDYLLEELGKIK